MQPRRVVLADGHGPNQANILCRSVCVGYRREHSRLHLQLFRRAGGQDFAVDGTTRPGIDGARDPGHGRLPRV